MDFVDVKSQYNAYKTEINRAVLGVLDSGDFVLGQECVRFEQDLVAYTRAPFALTCSNGSTALLLALLALDIKPGDEVITSCFSFIAAAEMIAFIGAKPVFVDICEDSCMLDPTQLESKITNKTKAIIPVSLFGQIYDVARVNAIAKAHGLFVIEDSAQSFGAMYEGRRACTFGDIGITSFFPSKPLGACGDGGAIFCDDEGLFTKLKMLRNHGQDGKYNHRYIGLNARLDSLQCAILRVKLKHFDDELCARQNLAQRYIDAFECLEAQKGRDLILPKTLPNRTHTFAQFCLRSRQREQILSYLAKAHIPVAIHYPKPLHLQPSMQFLGYKKQDFPISYQVSQEIFSLPLSAFLTQSQQDRVIQAMYFALH